jgi:hypothetical protein
MARARPRRSPIGFRTGPTALVAVTLFPAAVAGEQYERYAKAVWAKAHQWVSARWEAAAGPATTALDVRQILRGAAAIDVKRHLYPQEEQLLSEIVHEAWARREKKGADLEMQPGNG